MASKLDKDDYVYDIENLSALMASMDADGKEPGARPKKIQTTCSENGGEIFQDSTTTRVLFRIPPGTRKSKEWKPQNGTGNH